MSKDLERFFQDKNSIELNFEQIDSLMELGNIGSGNAVTALSDLLDKRIEMSLTHVSVIPFWKITSTLPEELKTEVFGIFSDVKGPTQLSIFQFFSKVSVMNMIKYLSHEHEKQLEGLKSLDDLDDFTLSIILEVGNILAGHYTSALANLMSTTLIPDVPDLVFDTLETILNSMVVKYSMNVDHLIIINTKIQIEGLKLKGRFCFIPDLETLKKIFKAINVDFEFTIPE